jgi:DNA-binding transcriptional ArsR family regulator
MKEIERVLKAMANRRRLAIVKYLKSEKEATVGDISGEIKLSFRSTSKHLNTLHSADVVEKEQRGSCVYYSLSPNSHRLVQAILAYITG